MFAATPSGGTRYTVAVDTDWFKRRLRERGMSLADIGRMVKRDRAVISRIVGGDMPLPLWMTTHFAEAVGVSEIEVLRRAGLQSNVTQAVPVVTAADVLAFVQHGDPADLDTDERLALDHASGPLFALKVDDDSMDQVAPAGSVIAVSYADRALRDRSLGLFCHADAVLFRRYRTDGQRVWLAPASWSDRHLPTPVGPELVILGRVVALPVLAAPE